ncbi:hypothetical protein OBBRIDRAFT_832915 [Obba rivulosa]|uniref:Uncharacterized protein n=1 Tax=Obba rivulosa TaxID=1052685 RepID=A0A8E2AYZ1_9APHY|nr:hypothetical protein OBBRIDRAFT_832915 [Obba rivulosa]
MRAGLSALIMISRSRTLFNYLSLYTLENKAQKKNCVKEGLHKHKVNYIDDGTLGPNFEYHPLPDIDAVLSAMNADSIIKPPRQMLCACGTPCASNIWNSVSKSFFCKP